MKKWLLGLSVVVALVAGWFLRLMWLAGEFKKLEPHFAGECTPVFGAVGAEDIVIHRAAGVAFISAADRRALMKGGAPRGGLYLYDLSDPRHRLRNLTPDASPEFHPHGVSLHVGPEGRVTLMVVNHERGNHTVEIYDWNGEVLAHRRTIAGPLMVSPNDLHALDHERFIVTNDHANPPGFARTIEEYFRREISNVLYYDGSRFHEAVGGIGLPNGVNASPDGRTLYVASTITGSIRTFDLDPSSGRLSPKGRIEIGSGVDNIDVDAEGRLWIACDRRRTSSCNVRRNVSSLSVSRAISSAIRSTATLTVPTTLCPARSSMFRSSSVFRATPGTIPCRRFMKRAVVTLDRC